MTFTSVTSTGGDAPGPQINGVALRQNLPWSQAHRTWPGRRVAGERRRHDIDVVTAQTVRQVKHGYFELGYLDRAVDIADEESQLLRHYESLARARYSQGVGYQQAVVKLQAEITRVLSRRQTFLRQRVEAESALNALRDRPADVTGPKYGSSSSGARTRLMPPTRRSRPRARAEVRGANARIQGAESAVRLSRRAHWPDVVVGGLGRVRGRRDAAGMAQVPWTTGATSQRLAGSQHPDLPVGLHAAPGRHRAGFARPNARLGKPSDASSRKSDSAVHLAVIDDQIDLLERRCAQAEQALKHHGGAYATGAVVCSSCGQREVLLDVRPRACPLPCRYLQALGDLERRSASPCRTGGGRP